MIARPAPNLNLAMHYFYTKNAKQIEDLLSVPRLGGWSVGLTAT